MRVLLITSIYNSKIGGLYNAIINRLVRLNNLDQNLKVDSCNIVEIDSFFVKILKKIMKLDLNNKKENLNDKLFTKIIYIKNSLFLMFLKRFFPKMYLLYLTKKVENNFDITEYNIIHAHWLYPHGSIANGLSKKYKKHLILTGHGSDVHTIYKKSLFIKNSIQQNLTYAKYITVVSKSLSENLLKEYNVDETKIYVIGNGVDLNLFKENKDNEYRNIKEEKKVVGYIGNLNHTKGSDRLPGIFTHINNEIKDVEYKIIGDGELKEQLIAEFKSLDLNTDFLGRISPILIPNYLNELDVLVLPSRNEGFGMIVIEANACGIPCIASNIGGIPEVINDSKLLVTQSQNFEKEFAQSVIEVLKKPVDKQKFIENAKTYDWEIIVKRECELYKSTNIKRWM